jgi:acetate kinase
MDRDHVLVVNAGSSSLKLSLLGEDSDDPLAQAELEAPGATVEPGELREVLAGELGDADVVGHRIVHGGSRYREAVLIDPQVRAALDELTALAPLHQPKSLAALDAVTAALPQLPAVACFDTAFHATIPAAAATFALPEQWRERWGLRRYGFHGLSHAHIARQVTSQFGGTVRVVSCHLGSGASLCAIAAGRSVETTMGFTPLDGLVMATRSGSVDPGLLLWLLEQTGMQAAEMGSALEHESGLKGLAGSGDMRAVLARRAGGDASARLAIDVYLHRLRAGIGAMAAALGGVDVIVFTGGVGEHAVEIREETVAGLGFLAGPVQVLTLTAREDLEIARQVRALSACGP